VSSSASPLTPPPGWGKARVNRWIRYHSEISFALTTQRTALESALIPITAYILVACVEAYRRYPELMRDIAAAMAPDDIGRTGHVVGNEIDSVRLWAAANFPLVGRNVLATAGMLDWAQDEMRMAHVFDFWSRAALAFRGDGHHQSADVGGVVTPYAAYVDDIVAACRPVASDDARRARIVRLNALLTSYEFLLWFDTRSGYQDSGPYVLGDGRVLLLRHFVKLGVSDFAWSAEVASQMPYSTALAAFVLRDTRVTVSDFGTVVTDPEDYLSRIDAFAFFDTSRATLVPVPDAAMDELAAAAKAAQRAQYRTIAAMDRRDKINAGAYVYFSFLRPFAVAAGVADQLDWTVPRDALDLYPLLELIEGTPEGPEVVDPGEYYTPIP
jgi:hypothetical protein